MDRKLDHSLISIPLDKILYDIENFSFVEGDLMPDGSAEDAHAAHMVFDIAKDGNQDLLRRSVRLASLEVIDILYPYAAAPSQHHPAASTASTTQGEDPQLTTHNSQLTTDNSQLTSVSFILKLPRGSADHTPALVKELARHYIAARALRDWMRITKPNVAAAWQARLDELKSSLQTAVVARLRPLRRRLSPF